MANRFCNPDDQYCDNTGTPYAGGFLFFYITTTSTPLTTYSDNALTIPNANPVVLDSAGRPGSIFLQNLAYKVVLKDVNSNIIWTMDPVSTSDFSSIAQFTTFAGNPNGNVAGTAGSGTTPSSVVWDRTNNILYVCTTTGNAATAVWTAVNPGTSATATIPRPGGYITPTSGTPVIIGGFGSGEANAVATAVYYTPYITNQCPIYNGSSFVTFNFTEQLLSLVAAHSSSTIFDVYAFLNSGVFTVGTGPGWTNSGAGTGSRGTGAGTTQLSLVSGIWTNAVAMTTRNGATTYSVAANQGTYLGSIFIDSSAGQSTFNCTYGQSRKWGAWNCYNRIPIFLKAGDSTASWNYDTNTLQPSNNATANSLTIFSGLPEERYDLKFVQRVQVQAGTTGLGVESFAITGIGFNSTTVASGLNGRFSICSTSGVTVQTAGGHAIANFLNVPSLGINTITSLNAGTPNGASSPHITFFGTEANMLLSATWRG